MEILDTSRTTSESVWWNRKWGKWETSWHEYSTHEKNALITKFLHENARIFMHIRTNLGLTH